MSKFLKIGCLTLAILFFIGLAFVAGIGVGSVATSFGESAQPKLRKTVLAGDGAAEIALLSLEGIILSSPAQEPFALAQGIITPDGVGQTLELALRDDAVKALIIRLDSPGGSAVASDEIYQHIKNTAAKKPVVILIGDTAASGGYYIASAGSYIFANPASMVGSIGVIAEITDIQ